MEDWGVMGVEGHTRRKEGSCQCWGWALLVQRSWCTKSGSKVTSWLLALNATLKGLKP